ncbi:MAG: B12-binding domain-containing radical SAM protein [Agathobacter sp.]|nr:B12-binding domain-containing radical SAM protein [Agathobacter sp.]
MKILLTAVNAKYIHSNPAVHILKTYAAEWSDHIEVAEYTINQQTESILADIYNRKPNVIAFSCYIWNWNTIERLIGELPKILPQIQIWLGGPEVTYDATKRLEELPAVTGVFVGEGEESFRDVATYYCSKTGSLEQIPGLCLQQYGYTGNRQPMEMDRVPFFYNDLTDFENKIMYYESSRGCPFSCSYCLSSVDKKVRLRSLSLVLPELQFFLDKKVPQVKFVDRTFNCNHAHAIGIWKYLLEHDNGVTNFHFEISADLLNEEELDILSRMRPGLVQLEIGVQSTNPKTIQKIHRTMDLDKLKQIVARIHEMRNIHQHIDLIAGLPYEDYASFADSFNEVYAMQPDQLQMGFLKVLKGAYMAAHTADYGLVFGSYPPYEVLATNWLGYAEVLKLKKVEEMVELYYNSNQFVHTLCVLEKAFASPFAMFETLGNYFEENGLFVNKPARSYRYEVLLEFAMSYDKENTALYKELLTYDIYLREKCKSRPTFATDLSAYRNELRKREKDKRNHIDIFCFPVWETDAQKIQKGTKVPVFLEFDYEKRDPLTHNAKVRKLL